jgi:predicted aldo/keto reductase-like oxidoreductase
MTSKELIDEYVAASGATKVSQHDLEILAAYANMRAGNYCMPGCNACQDSCPEHAPVSEVLRTRMYDVDYGDRSFARAEYAQLPVGAAACLTCAHHACLNACPVGVPIEQFMRDAATRLG